MESSSGVGHSHNVLLQLYTQSKRGQGTDLEVRCPNDTPCADGSTYTTFHLHSLIVSCSSDYFARFPEPRIGRIIQEIDSKTFHVCLEFMYLGEVKVTHDTVADLLHAAELLAITKISDACFAYLRKNLCRENHETVRELAETFQNPSLVAASQRFLTRGEDGHIPMHSYLQDDALDLFGQLLTRRWPDDKIRLDHVIIRKLEKMYPNKTTTFLWEKARNLPFHFNPLFLWKSRKAFMDAVKNLRRKIAKEGGHYRGDEIANNFQIQTSVDSNLDHVLSQNGVRRQTIIDALFCGLSERSVQILRSWRFGYLKWRRQYYQDSMWKDYHIKQAKKELDTIFPLQFGH